MTILKKVIPEEKAQHGISIPAPLTKKQLIVKKPQKVEEKVAPVASSEDETASETETENSTEISCSDFSSETEGESDVERRISIPPPPPTCLPDGGDSVGIFSNDKSHGREKLLKRLRKDRPWTICLTHCRYDIVRNVARKYKLAEVNEDESWNIYWTDFSVSMERALDMRHFQIINHFPGMNEICRKDLLSRNLNRMKRLFNREYDIFPKTWSLPADLAELQNYALCRRNKIYICKPEMGCQGRGIFLIRNIKELNPFGKIVCQLYLAKPYLLNNLKFDLRLYALITSVTPLRIYIYKEGLARFATAKYKPPTNNNNTENSFMHLTNYAINKFSRDYIVDDESGSKRRATSVWKSLAEQGHNIDLLSEQVDDVIIKTIFSAEKILRDNYNYCFPERSSSSACFEILGFDIIFDHKLKPYVLEVNHSPSFHTDAKLDLEIKEALLNDTFAMLNLKNLPKSPSTAAPREKRVGRLLVKTPIRIESTESEIQSEQMQHELENCGGYRLIYPAQTSAKYERYFQENWNKIVPERIAVTTACPENSTPSEIKQCINSEEQPFKREVFTAVQDSPKAKVEKEIKGEPQSLVPMNKSNKRNPFFNSFTPNFIKPEEELERTKAIMQRGLLIRSLGIEIQVYKLLRDMGGIKVEEEKLYQRLYGHCSKANPTQE